MRMDQPSSHNSPEFSHGSFEFEFDRNFEVTAVTVGKNPPRNEDVVAIGDGYLIVADGATDKSGLRFEEDPTTGSYKTGGEVAASITATIASTSGATGVELIRDVTRAIRDYYTTHDPEALTDSAYRFATTLICARIVGDTLVMTQVGDSFFRINGVAYANNKEVDAIRAGERIAKINELAALRPDGMPTESDIAAGRAAIQNELNRQHLLQNNANDPLGYGVLDGADVPEAFIKTFEFPLAEIETIELASDGYYSAFPSEATTAAWEAIHQRQLEVDPYNIGEFPSTKGSSDGRPGDDRSVIIARRIHT